MNRSVLQTIRNGMDTFSKGQKRIANYILENYDKAAFMTASKLGQTAQVSESTVVRFAAELGYDGYPDMQKELQELIRGKLTSIQRIQVSSDQMSGGDILGSVMQRDMNSIHDIIEELDRDEFERVVDKLLHAKHIYILGVRSSSFLAGYLNFYMHFIFENVTLVQSAAAGEIYEQLVHIGPGDVLLSICFPRYSKMAIHAVQFAWLPQGGCYRHHRQPHVTHVPDGHAVAAGAQRYDILCGFHDGAAEPAERPDTGGGQAAQGGAVRRTGGHGTGVVEVRYLRERGR